MSPLWTSLMLLCLYCGRLCSALRAVQMQSLQVEYGEPAVLPCNGSAYREEEGSVLWEAMGEDVALLRRGELKQGDKFQDRVLLPSAEQLREGDWSVVLESTTLSDTNMYECIWQGRETISTVWLTVMVPHQRSIVVSAGDAVDLTCYIQISDSMPIDDVQVWWTRNGSTIVEDLDTEKMPRVALWFDTREGASHLSMSPTVMSDSGEYNCLYRTRDSAASRLGIPECVTLTVLETNPTDITGMTEAWPMGTTEETVTLFPDEATLTSETPTYQDVPETSPESFQLDTFPWIRIGLISGVLLVTAVVLCVLKSLQKI